MEVPGGRVSGNPSQEPVLAQQRLKVGRGLGDSRGRDADVLHDERGPGRAQPADESVETLANAPVHLDRLGVAVPFDGADQLPLPHRFERRPLPRIQRLRVGAAELEEEHR